MSGNYLLFTDQQYGPYGLETLKTSIQQGQLAPETWVFREGETTEWTRADEVGSLKEFFQSSMRSVPVTSPSSAKKLGERVKESMKVEEDENFGTMLVVPGRGQNIKAAAQQVQQAPNSDITPSVSSRDEGSPTPQTQGLFSRLFGMFRKSKAESTANR